MVVCPKSVAFPTVINKKHLSSEDRIQIYQGKISFQRTCYWTEPPVRGNNGWSENMYLSINRNENRFLDSQEAGERSKFRTRQRFYSEDKFCDS